MITPFNDLLAKTGHSLALLNEDHTCEFFTCGLDGDMDTWLASTARRWQAESFAQVWILSPTSNPDAVHGFFTLSSLQILPGDITRRDRALDPTNRQWVNGLDKAYPAQLIGKFALSADMRGRGFGPLLMACAFDRYLEVASLTGTRFLLVDTRKEKLIRYYQNLGFRMASSQSDKRLYMSTGQVRSNLNQLLSRFAASNNQ